MPGRGHESLARLYWSRDLRDIRKKKKVLCVPTYGRHKLNVAIFNDDYVKAFRRLGGPVVMSTALECYVNAESIRPGGKMNFCWSV